MAVAPARRPAPCEWNDQPWLCGLARTGYWPYASAMTWLPPPSPGAVANEAMAWPNIDAWPVSDAIKSCLPFLSGLAGAGSATKLTPCGELKLKPGALSADNSGVNAPVEGSTWPNAFRLPTEA